jgi:TM2 domain-containing membrane protein YozV
MSESQSVQIASTQARPVSGDARAMMMFEANKKSMVVAYLLWFFLGGFGGHRFFCGKTGSAVAQLLLMIGGCALFIVGIGALMLISLYIWVLVDAFLIPGWIRNQNSLLAMQLGGS